MDKKKIILFQILGAIGIYGVILLFSLVIDDEIDKKLLLILNPDNYIPVIDELMVLITKFSMYSFAVVYIFWCIGFIVYRTKQDLKQKIWIVFKIIGVIMGLIICSAFFWAGFEYRIIFIPFGIAIFIAFWLTGKSFTTATPEMLSKYGMTFIIILISVVFSNAIGEVMIKNIVGRFRPLADYYAPWNESLRTISDAISRGGFSYVSGHASAFFALITPLMWSTLKKGNKILLFTWAAVHALTRVYLVAHWPFCAFMGSIMGFFIGTLTYHLFKNWNSILKNE